MWTYTLNNTNPTVAALNASQQLSDTITVTSADGTQQTVSITIHGTNDAPVITTATGGNLGTVKETGDIAGILDKTQPGGFEPDAALLMPAVTAALNTISTTPGDLANQLDAIVTALGGKYAQAIGVVWDFLDDAYVAGGYYIPNINEAFIRFGVEYVKLVQNGTIAPLTEVIGKFAADRQQSLHDNLLGNLSDGSIDGRLFGEPLTSDLKSLVAGVDPDLATRTYYGGYSYESEAAARAFDVANGLDSSVTGQLSATDADNGASLTWSGSAPGTYGAFTIDANTGAWKYTLNNADADTLALHQGQIVTETFTAFVSDGQSGSTPQVVTITITGANDAPVLGAAQTALTAATEDVAYVLSTATLIPATSCPSPTSQRRTAQSPAAAAISPSISPRTTTARSRSRTT